MSALKYTSLLLLSFCLLCFTSCGFASNENLLRSKRAVGRIPKNVVGNCGGNVSGEMGLIASPNLPRRPYPPSSSCNWTVAVGDDRVIKLTFVYMDMEDGPVQKRSNCGTDSISIYDRNNLRRLVGNQRYCGYDTVFHPIYSSTNEIEIRFVSDEIIQRRGFIIRWEEVPIPETMFSCDFEEALCPGWNQLDSDNFDWTFRNGETPSKNTGPRYDHTLSSIGNYRDGFYAYIEASGKRVGEEAVLMSPPFQLETNNRPHCLVFWYNMRGNGMGSIKVDRVPLGQPRTSGRNIFQANGNHGELWQEARVDINGGGETVQFLFIGVRGPSFRSDAAIDDITIIPNRCDANRRQ